jgi:glycosyltransferase involved in cell wall biosynthesis
MSNEFERTASNLAAMYNRALIDEISMRKVLLDARATINLIRPGWIYLLGSSTGFYKIGQTTDIERRFKNFGVKLPFEVWIEHSWRVVDCIWTEKYAHALFGKNRVNGEWFILEQQDIATFTYLSDESDLGLKIETLKTHTDILSWDNAKMGEILFNFYLTQEERYAHIFPSKD